MLTNPSHAARIYQESANRCSWAIRQGYAALRSIITDQFGALPCVVVDSDVDPFATFREMREHFKETGQLVIYSGNLEHPIFTAEENFMFRAVHDFHGHLELEIPFASFQDEVSAYLAHSQLFPRTFAGSLARQAMAQEVIGQAGHFHTFGAYPEQLAGLFPLQVI